MELIIFAILGLFALMIIVTIHELGHFFAAKKLGVKVEEFGIGFPPKIKSIKRGGTTYSLNWLPLGGFVRLHGELLGENPKYPEKAFQNAKPWKKIVIALAGIVMNFVLAVVCFTIVYSTIGIPREVETGKVTILSVEANTPAQTAGIIVGDTIKTVNKESVTTADQFRSLVDANKGKRTQIVLERKSGENTEEKNITVTPRENPPEGQGSLGVGIASTTTEIYYPPIWQRPITGLQEAIKQTLNFTNLIFGGLGDVGTQVSQGQIPQQICGPLCIMTAFIEQIRRSLVDFIGFIGIVSLNLAIINLIPFPPLDGSRVLFVILEKFVGKKRLPKIEGYAYTAGFIFLMILVVLITGKEIIKLAEVGSLSAFMESMVQQ